MPSAAEVLRRLNANAELPRRSSRESFPRGEGTARRSRSITFGRAIAEFEFTLVFADAPIDRYARGDRNALSDATEARRACSSSAGRAASSVTPCRASRTRCSATSASTSRRAAGRAGGRAT